MQFNPAMQGALDQAQAGGVEPCLELEQAAPGANPIGQFGGGLVAGGVSIRKN